MAGVTAASERPSTREAPLAAVVIPAAGITEIGVGLSAAAIALDLAAAESDETAAGADGAGAGAVTVTVGAVAAVTDKPWPVSAVVNCVGVTAWYVVFTLVCSVASLTATLNAIFTRELTARILRSAARRRATSVTLVIVTSLYSTVLDSDATPLRKLSALFGFPLNSLLENPVNSVSP